MKTKIENTLVDLIDILVEMNERLEKLEKQVNPDHPISEKPVPKTVETVPKTEPVMSDVPPWSFDIRKLIPDEVKQRCPETMANIVLWNYDRTAIPDWKWTGIQLLRAIGAGDYDSAQRAVDYACEEFDLTDKQWNSVIKWVMKEVKAK